MTLRVAFQRVDGSRELDALAVVTRTWLARVIAFERSANLAYCISGKSKQRTQHP